MKSREGGVGTPPVVILPRIILADLSARGEGRGLVGDRDGGAVVVVDVEDGRHGKPATIEVS